MSGLAASPFFPRTEDNVWGLRRRRATTVRQRIAVLMTLSQEDATFIRCHAASSAHFYSEFIVMFLRSTVGVVGIHNNPCTRLLCASCATKLAEVLNSSRRVISELYLPSS